MATTSGGSGGESNSAGKFAHTTGVQRVAGFVVVGFVLMAAADIPTLSTLAVAFAYLVMISVLMSAGPTAFGRITSLVEAK